MLNNPFHQFFFCFHNIFSLAIFTSNKVHHAIPIHKLSLLSFTVHNLGRRVCACLCPSFIPCAWRMLPILARMLLWCTGQIYIWNFLYLRSYFCYFLPRCSDKLLITLSVYPLISRDFLNMFIYYRLCSMLQWFVARWNRVESKYLFVCRFSIHEKRRCPSLLRVIKRSR